MRQPSGLGIEDCKTSLSLRRLVLIL